MERKGICKNVGACSKANKVQIITDDDAEFVCPECGEELQPYKEEEIVPKKNKKRPLIIGATVIVLIIIGAIIALIGGNSEPNDLPEGQPEDTLQTQDGDTVVKTDTIRQIDTVTVEKIVEKPIASKPKSSASGSATSSGTLRLSYGTYTGTIKNGYPNGQGKLVYSTTRQINKYDTKGRTAQPGDYVQGEFVNGFFTIGKHYNAQGELIESLNIGVADDVYEAK